MKKQIRYGVFETNSSSVHSITMCPKELFEEWKNGNILYDTWEKEFIPIKPLTNQDKENARIEYESSKNNYMKNWNELSDELKNQYYLTYQNKHTITSEYSENKKTYIDFFTSPYGSTETFTSYYTTPNGEEIVAFGYYGYDG